MEENEIMQMIETEAVRRHASDRSHLDGLLGELNDGLPQWSARRRLVSRITAMLVLLAVPAAYVAVLPRPVENTRIICNQNGGTDAVMNCATTILIES